MKNIYKESSSQKVLQNEKQGRTDFYKILAKNEKRNLRYFSINFKILRAERYIKSLLSKNFIGHFFIGRNVI